MKPIPYGRQNIDDSDIRAIVDTLNSDFLTQGPKVKEFENKFSKYVGSKYAVAVSNATAALHLAVLSLGLKKGERVITTPITFAATANCVRYVGGEVWFADIDKDTWNISPKSIERLITKKTKAIIPVHLYGNPANLEELKKISLK